MALGRERRSGGTPSSAASGRRRWGFTLTELLLVVAILGLLVLIVIPHIRRAQENAAVSALKAEVRNLVTAAEEFRVQNQRLPETVEELEAAEGFYPSDDAEYCVFLRVPASDGDGSNLMIVLGHPVATRVVFTIYPQMAGRVTEIETGQFGCGFF